MIDGERLAGEGSAPDAAHKMDMLFFVSISRIVAMNSLEREIGHMDHPLTLPHLVFAKRADNIC
jgi:hypothetical protein